VGEVKVEVELENAGDREVSRRGYLTVGILVLFANLLDLLWQIARDVRHYRVTTAPRNGPIPNL
jgi:hypothetical protein